MIDIIIITGLSGSGKSTAIAALEDAGFYCVDNMPVALLPKFLELPLQSNPDFPGAAFVMDLREKGFLGNYEAVFDSLRKKDYHFEVLFLEADEEVLLQRYSQTRRQHPLSAGKSVIEGIRAEKEQLKDLRRSADLILNTSRHNVHELKSAVSEIAKKYSSVAPMHIGVISFGYKYGIPSDSDLIIDVRFLANPYFIPEMRDLTGESEIVERFVLGLRETRTFLRKYLDLLDFLIPRYRKEKKAYLTIAVGCTGGQHRSVVLARKIFQHLSDSGLPVELVHRDLNIHSNT